MSIADLTIARASGACRRALSLKSGVIGLAAASSAPAATRSRVEHLFGDIDAIREPDGAGLAVGPNPSRHEPRLPVYAL